MAPEKSQARRNLTIAGIVLAALLMLSGAIVYFLPTYGWRIDGLRSGSMEPQLMIGDLIVTRPAKLSDIKVGDIIMSKSPSGTAPSIISHRVVGIKGTSSLFFQTKGDANADADPFLVPDGEVVGMFSFRVPLAGYLVIQLKTFPGLLISLIAPGFILIYICLKSIRNELVAQRSKGLKDVGV